MTDPPVTPAVLSVRTGIHVRTIRRHCTSGIINGAQKIGRDWQIPARAADQYAEEYKRYQTLRAPRKG